MGPRPEGRDEDRTRHSQELVIPMRALVFDALIAHRTNLPCIGSFS
jgi:hypothetical protein